MDQQFSLSWNNFHGNLTKGFASLLGKGEFVDVTIAVEGHVLQAHKVILSICSPYFKKMFQMNPCQHPIVVLRDITYKAMRDLLLFMYHGEVSVKREDLTSFISTAEVLQIKGLTNKETEEDTEKEQELPKHATENNITDGDSHISDTFDTNANLNDETTQNNDLDVLKHRQFIEKLQKFSNLKRKSDEFIQKSYYSDILNPEKKPKIKEKSPYNQQSNHMLQSNNYENLKSFYEDRNDISTFKSQVPNTCNSEAEINDKSKDQSPSNNSLDVKTECDDMDIIVTDPAVCTTPKSYDGSRDGKKDATLPVDYQSPQDNCTSLNSLFIDLKNLVNGKVTNNMSRTNVNEEFLRPTMDHRLITIPQKEDGKKKYPQRSCRLCWKIGKRRDTRFMCSACELPFCKSPCFEIHFNDVLKISQLQGDYYAT
ncbi:transcription regulator protein BACH1-like isoform X1 [Galleria mellonella]|uniref:Transcription regulator protein BACH1-like isoform X1 n=1 Tax=Galleria mellonella TaxID=7137 RepID=A0A6J1X266_GALME|nr:transcription regulator protein BACH1-like isoform X1 [Galleria mellonella]